MKWFWQLINKWYGRLAPEAMKEGYRAVAIGLGESVDSLIKQRDKAESERDDLIRIFALQRKREQPWIERWREETGKHDTIPDYGAMMQWIMDKADLAEAHVMVMIGMLDKWKQLLLEHGDPFNGDDWQMVQDIRDAMANAEDLVYIPGDWVCPACNFRRHQRRLHAPSGAVSVSQEIPDPCPNDGTPLGRLTWRQDAQDANRVALDLVKENRKLREGKQ